MSVLCRGELFIEALIFCRSWNGWRIWPPSQLCEHILYSAVYSVHVVLIFPFSRLCRCALILEGIESVHFRGPSYMGERVLVQTSVNRVFSNNRLDMERTGFCIQARQLIPKTITCFTTSSSTHCILKVHLLLNDKSFVKFTIWEMQIWNIRISLCVLFYLALVTWHWTNEKVCTKMILFSAHWTIAELNICFAISPERWTVADL
jgi:hypothetical protein